jgi:hypothetical protein
MTFLFLLVVLYFLPTILGHNKRDSAGIFIVNLLFGWTIIGWFIALLWAAASDHRVTTVLVPAGVPMSPRCRCGAPEPVGAQYCWSCGRHL